MKVETHDDITDETSVVEIPDTYDTHEIIKLTDEAIGNPPGLVDYDEVNIEADGTIIAKAGIGTMHPMTATFKVIE